LSPAGSTVNLAALFPSRYALPIRRFRSEVRVEFVRRHVLAWGPAALWALVLFLLSELREVPDPLQPLTVLPSLLIHVLLYSTFGAALAWGRHLGPIRPPHALLLAVGYAYGALDEWHQSFVPGRTPSVADWVADVVGVTAGYWATTAILRATAKEAT
jgi:VanZ family protein